MNALAPRLFDMVSGGQLDSAIDQLIALFRAMEGNPLLAGTAFPFPLYDEVCAAIGNASAFELLAPRLDAVTDDHDLVVVTEAMVQGGHVELIRDIADAGERKVVIVATNLYDRSPDVVQRALADHSRVLTVLTLDAATLVGRLRALQYLMANPASRRVIVMCHGHDAVAISAAAAVKDKPVLFFHHCDHTPCLGCYMPNAQHIDLHNIAFNRCHQDLGLDPGYICMTSRNGGARRVDRPYAQPVFKTITCGGEHKLENLKYSISYIDVVVDVLAIRRGTHFHVGILSPQFINRIHHALDAAGLTWDTFVHIGHVSGFREIIDALEIDLYVPTLPQSGGKALIDVMAAGVPILVHENAVGRLWGGRDLVYPEAPSWRDVSDLRICLKKFDDIDYWREQSQASSRYFEANHSLALFERMLAANGRLAGVAPPALKPYRPSHEERLRASVLAAGH